MGDGYAPLTLHSWELSYKTLAPGIHLTSVPQKSDICVPTLWFLSYSYATCMVI